MRRNYRAFCVWSIRPFALFSLYEGTETVKPDDPRLGQAEEYHRIAPDEPALVRTMLHPDGRTEMWTDAELRNENARLRAELEKAHAAGVREGVATVCDRWPGINATAAQVTALVRAAQDAVARCWTSAPGISMPSRTRGINIDDLEELAEALKPFEE